MDRPRIAGRMPDHRGLDLTLVQAHQIAEDTEHQLLHDVRRLTAATVHADPYDSDPQAHHAGTSRHRESLAGPS